MTRLISLILLFAAPLAFAGDSAALIQSAPVQNESNHLRAYRWVRRATMIGACLSGTVLDTWALDRLAANSDVRLSGPFISNGKPEYGQLVGLFAGSCALSAFMQEKHIFAARESRGLDLTYTLENVGSMGVSLWATERFLNLSNQAAAEERTQPGTPAAMPLR